MAGRTDREEPVWILAVVQFIVEIPRASSHELSPLSEGQSPAYSPVRHSADESVQGVLQQDIDGVLRPDRKFYSNHSSIAVFFVVFLT